MGILNVTLIDVGWGDSIFIEHVDEHGVPHYGLVDSNDSKGVKSTRTFIERFFRLKRQTVPFPLFDFVLLSHGHDDHAKGLGGILREYGAGQFLHAKSKQETLGPIAPLIKYCMRANSKVGHFEAVDRSKRFPDFGDVEIDVLWPQRDRIDSNENNNSVVLALRYDRQSIVLTGDVEEEVWETIASEIPADTVFFKVPHHGSRNGSLDRDGHTTWLPHCPAQARLGISCMYRRDYRHPHEEVLAAFTDAGRIHHRTDEQYHVTVALDGVHPATVKYSHT